jgi:hypothetical protein
LACPVVFFGLDDVTACVGAAVLFRITTGIGGFPRVAYCKPLPVLSWGAFP